MRNKNELKNYFVEICENHPIYYQQLADYKPNSPNFFICYKGLVYFARVANSRRGRPKRRRPCNDFDSNGGTVDFLYSKAQINQFMWDIWSRWILENDIPIQTIINTNATEYDYLD
ncbi:hypothetical protein [Xylocopilactobacillus apis]|uniref:Uncharacterized protein n=1 Tax=Xylocopilactobacillus apis TaxID=2932183 RepID=A0AAU9DB07_9LACO|nr:hypothetical protein [Xylocopilactobacillus apis]BDR56895.1 hypothetical protein KIMC2_14570 [Xylocopilactobacillus apis]